MITIEVSIGDVLEHDSGKPPQQTFLDRLPWWMRYFLRWCFNWPKATPYEVWQATGDVAEAFAKTLAEHDEPEPELTNMFQEDLTEWN